MLLYPDIQKRGQEAVCQVIGNGRLPNFTDSQSIPYIDAILKEVLRWRPVAPLGNYLHCQIAPLNSLNNAGNSGSTFDQPFRIDLLPMIYIMDISYQPAQWLLGTPGEPQLSALDDIFETEFFRAILHDTSTYGNDVDAFRPERFFRGDKLDPNVPHPDAAFGFGRRACPGQDMAWSSMWLTIATVLFLFDIRKPVDDTGAPIEPSGEYTSGMQM
jgi:cytochrome P450